MKMLPHLCLLTTAILSVLAAATAPAQDAQLLPNGDLEGDPEAWRIKENVPMTRVSPDAAHQGNTGLRVDDDDPVEGSSAVSPRIDVAPGQRYRISFWGRTGTPGAVGVYAWFYKKAAGAFIGQNPAPMIAVNQSGPEWHKYSFEVEAPAEAGFMALWVHSLGKGTGSADLDDFVIEEL
jgi:hypothetical protein